MGLLSDDRAISGDVISIMGGAVFLLAIIIVFMAPIFQEVYTAYDETGIPRSQQNQDSLDWINYGWQNFKILGLIAILITALLVALLRRGLVRM